MMLSQSRKIAFVLLVVFLASLGSWSFNAKRLSHEVEHDRLITQLASVAHASDHDHIDAAEGNESLSDAEHCLLHAAGQLPPISPSTFSWMPPMHDGAMRPLFVSPHVAHSTREPPFRPPRSIPS